MGESQNVHFFGLRGFFGGTKSAHFLVVCVSCVWGQLQSRVTVMADHSEAPGMQFGGVAVIWAGVCVADMCPSHGFECFGFKPSCGLSPSGSGKIEMSGTKPPPSTLKITLLRALHRRQEAVFTLKHLASVSQNLRQYLGVPASVHCVVNFVILPWRAGNQQGDQSRRKRQARDLCRCTCPRSHHSSQHSLPHQCEWEHSFQGGEGADQLFWRPFGCCVRGL